MRGRSWDCVRRSRRCAPGWRCFASSSMRGRRGTTWGDCWEGRKARKAEGGRNTPFFKGYRPQFYFRTTDVTGTIELPAGVEMVMPGDNIKMTIELISQIAMEEGLGFAIREGGKTVGAGVVAKILK